MKTLFLHPPSFDGFDGGAGSRYQAKREIRSFWYPTWLAQPAALVPGSKLIDAPADGTPIEDVLAVAKHYELVIMHTSAPSFLDDARVAELLKEANPRLLVGMVGAQGGRRSGGLPRRLESHRLRGARGIRLHLQGRGRRPRRSLTIAGLSFRRPDGEICSTIRRAPMIEDMDALPWVAPVYQRDLKIENYFIGYLKHPYVSVYTGRGCRSKCTFCLWPQTVGGHRYRVRSPQNVIDEVRWIKEQHAAGEGDLLRRRHLHRFPSARRGDRPRLGQAGRDLVLQRQGERALRDAQGDEGQRPAAAARRLRVGQRSDPAQHPQGSAHRHRAPLHRAIAASSASPSTARSFSASPARPRRRSARPSSMRSTSIRTPSRSRWRRLIRARSSTSRRSTMAGSPRPMHPSSSTTRACNSRP